MTDLAGIPIRCCESLGPEPFCKLMPNFELTADLESRQMPGEQIICNPAGLELLKAEIAKRNAAAQQDFTAGFNSALDLCRQMPPPATRNAQPRTRTPDSASNSQ